jgi:molybdopterin-binding protein
MKTVKVMIEKPDQKLIQAILDSFRVEMMKFEMGSSVISFI